MTPDHMTDDEIRARLQSPEYRAALASVMARMRAGEPITGEQIAAELGLPWMVFARALAEATIDILAAHGIPAVAIVADDAPATKH